MHHLIRCGVLATVVALASATPAAAAPAAIGVFITSEMNGNDQFDLGEGVSAVFCVNNPDPVPTPILEAALQVGGGVDVPSAPQIVGSIPAGRSLCRTFTFRASGACGTPVVATLNLNTGVGPIIPLTYVLPTGPTLLAADFDLVGAPSLPVGLSGSASGATPGWQTVAGGAHSGRNRGFAVAPVGISNAALTTLDLPLPAGTSVVTFRNAFETETGFDGGVLEISVAGGAFQDVITAGGVFLSGGYTGLVSGIKGSAIGGRQAWTGSSGGGYLTSQVLLPLVASGQSVRLRWRFVTDTTVGGGGWSVDSIAVSSTTCAAVPQDVPWGQTAFVRGNAVTLRWNAPIGAAATGYLLEVSPDDGATFPYVFPLGAPTTFAATGPDGRFWTRLRATTAGATSAPSPLLYVPVGTALEPATPRNLLASSAGPSRVALTWSLDEHGGSATGVLLEAGSAPGLSDVAAILLPSGTTSAVADGVAAATYHLRVRQQGQLGSSEASEAAVLTVPGACLVPAAPPFLRVSRQLGGFLFTWELGAPGSAAPTGWALHAGTAPGLADIGAIPLGERQFFTPSPPTGIYYVRAVAANDCGTSAASNEVTLVVP
jgi:hypothetical protein